MEYIFKTIFLKSFIGPLLILFSGIFINAQTISGPVKAILGRTSTYSIPASTPVYPGYWTWSAITGSIEDLYSDPYNVDVVWNTIGTHTVRFSYLVDYENWITETVELQVEVVDFDPLVVNYACEQSTLQRIGTPLNGETWYWQGKTADGTSTTKGSGVTFIANEGSGFYYIRIKKSDGTWMSALGAVYVSMVEPVSWYQDLDGDGIGNPNVVLSSCTQPTGYVDNNGIIVDGNYVHTIIPTVETSNISGLSNDKKIESIAYYDGLGRLIQNIAIRAGGNQEDIITHMEYDDFGRETKEYLPYSSTSNNGLFRSTSKIMSTNFYKTTKYENTPNSYSEKTLEISPLGKVLSQSAPGFSWRKGGRHEIEFDYQKNISSEVRKYEVTLSFANNTYTPTLVLNGRYGANQLYKSIVYDENHTSGTEHSTEEFKDKQGRVLLKRTYIETSKHDTYYVYDDYGNLTYVLPPKSESGGGIPDSTKLSELCYQYKYDHRNRLVEKKIPGKGWEYIVYNKLDQPVMSQDANLEAQNKWLVTKYDAFGRVAYTGVLNSNADRNTLQTNANAVNTVWVTKGSEINLGGTKISYDKGGYPDANAGVLEILTVNYYDNHTFNTAGLTIPTGSIYNQNIVTGLEIKGLETGRKVKVLGTTAPYWITSIIIYDKKRLPIYIASENEYLNTTDIVQTKYDFVGKVLKTRTRHQKDSDDEIVTLDVFEYDHVGRLISERQCIGDDALPDDCNTGIGNENLVFNSVVTSSKNEVANGSITLSPGFHVVATASLSFSASITPRNNSGELIVKNHYDELGQLDRKKVGGTSAEGLQTVDYTYNIRGWLKGINNEAGSNASIVLEANDLFGFQINYNNPSNISKALFNGNISETLWKTTNVDNSLKSYTYTYDALNRITSGIDNTNHYNLSNITYDKNGNILSLTRGGHLVEEPNPEITSHWGNMDVLTYSYQANSNTLEKVTDGALNTSGKGEFIDGNTSGSDYTYDTNGNMTSDANKGITTITYNHLNLPTQVNFGSTNSIKYIYDATGVKLKKIVSTGATTEYAGNYVYENSGLKFFNTSEGYFDVTSLPLEELEGYYVYQYKDHLGNIRLSYKDNSGSLEILEENNYYPFGLKHKGYNNVVNSSNPALKKKFNGVELEEALGLNLYEMEFRNYDASVGRFNSIDPMAEERISLTPYNFVQNNPILRIDPSGLLDTYGVNEDGEIRHIDYKKYYDADGNEIDKLVSDKTKKSIMVGDGVLDNKKSKKIDGVKLKDGTVVDVNTTELKLKGDDKGKKLFNFLADNTNVEWSQIKVGEKGTNEINYIASGRLTEVEPAGSNLLSTVLRGANLREHKHSHPDRIMPRPSVADKRFAESIKAIYGELVSFKVRAVKSKNVREYDETGLLYNWLFDKN